MENKNIVITLSGEPVSGKSTAYKNLKDIYEEHGFKVVKFSTGSLFRQMANERNMTVLELNEYAKTHPEIDEEVDGKLIEIQECLKSNYHPNTIFVIDSRMAWHFIPDSLSVRLTVSPYIAGKRLLADSSRTKEDQHTDLNEAIIFTEKRKQEEQKRYYDIYGVDLCNLDNYDLVIDTTATNPEDVSQVIYQCSQLQQQQKPFAKFWRTPKCFLPTQDIRASIKSCDEKIADTKSNMTIPNIYAVEKDGYYYVLDGHNRVGASILLNRSLIPYELVDNKDGIINVPGIAAYHKNILIAAQNTPSRTYDFEDTFKFRYTEVYSDYPFNRKKDENIQEL